MRSCCWRKCEQSLSICIHRSDYHDDDDDDDDGDACTRQYQQRWIIQTGGPALLADRGLRLREGRIGPDLVNFSFGSSQIILNVSCFDLFLGGMVACLAKSMNLFWNIKAVSKVRDEVEERLVKESDNVRLWQMRIKTAIEQVVLTIVTPPLRNQIQW